MSDIADQKALGGSDEQKSEGEQLQDKAAVDYSGAGKTGAVTMDVKIRSPFHDYYDGPAFSVSAENATGPFDILPRHHNFISLLLPCDLVIRTTNQGEQKIRISGGIMHVKADELIVFLDV